VTSVRRWPWPFLLLLLGAGVASTRLTLPVSLSSSVVLIGFLPALLFDAGFSLHGTTVRQEWRWIALFGLAGGVVAGGIAFGALTALGVNRGEALLLAAVLAATDPIAVFAALRRVRTPVRLRITLEGESLANDGVAVVLTTLALQIVDDAGVQPVALLFLFLRLTLLGLAVGSVIGLLGRPALKRVPRPADILLTLALAYGVYLLSDRIGGSGLLAVISLAFVLGTAYPVATHHHLHRFWRALGAVMAGALFLLMGLQVPLDIVLGTGWRLAALVVVVWAARALMVVLFARAAPRRWPWRWQAALTWAGLRGALSLALAISIPIAVRDRAEVLALVSGFILVSLALQGLTIGPVFRWLRVSAIAPVP
jgi:Na+:H+ antiporter